MLSAWAARPGLAAFRDGDKAAHALAVVLHESILQSGQAARVQRRLSWRVTLRHFRSCRCEDGERRISRVRPSVVIKPYRLRLIRSLRQSADLGCPVFPDG